MNNILCFRNFAEFSMFFKRSAWCKNSLIISSWPWLVPHFNADNWDNFPTLFQIKCKFLRFFKCLSQTSFCCVYSRLKMRENSWNLKLFLNVYPVTGRQLPIPQLLENISQSLTTWYIEKISYIIIGYVCLSPLFWLSLLGLPFGDRYLITKGLN